MVFLQEIPREVLLFFVSVKNGRQERRMNEEQP